jgi:Flp pilus assembly protein TadD
MAADQPQHPPAGASPRAAFERLLASGKDGALLRYSLGNECLKAGEHAAAIDHLSRATALDPRYTAAWKLLGKALQAAGRDDDALNAYRRGIDVARVRGDKQAEKEMTVFAKRIEKGAAKG